MAGQQEKTMKITIDRSTVEQALEALSLALSDVDWRANSPTQPVIHKAHTALKAALAEPVQQKEHCLWARNGNEPCPHVQQAEPVQEPIGFVNAAHLQGLTLGLYGYAEIYVHDSVGRIPLYTSVPPKRTPLTDDEIVNLSDLHSGCYGTTDFARAIEAAHGIK